MCLPLQVFEGVGLLVPQEATYYQEDQPPQLGEDHQILKKPEPLNLGAVNPLKTPTLPGLEGRRDHQKSETLHVREAIRLSPIPAVPTRKSSPEEDDGLHH